MEGDRKAFSASAPGEPLPVGVHRAEADLPMIYLTWYNTASSVHLAKREER